MIFDISLVVGLFGFWALVSKLCFHLISCPEHLKPKEAGGKKTKHYYDYYGNFFSIAHALLTLVLGTITLLVEEPSLGQKNSFLDNLVVYNSFAYFLYDTIQSEYYGYNALPMTLHHLTSTAVTGSMIYLQNSGNEVVIALVLAEISNPFNLWRDIIKYNKQEGTQYYFLVSLAFATLFIITRFVFIPFQIIRIYPGPTHLAVKILAATVWFISWHWLFIILNLLAKETKAFVEKLEGKNRATEIFYFLMSDLRKSKAFKASFYATAAFLSFGTLYLTHSQ